MARTNTRAHQGEAAALPNSNSNSNSSSTPAPDATTAPLMGPEAADTVQRQCLSLVLANLRSLFDEIDRLDELSGSQEFDGDLVSTLRLVRELLQAMQRNQQPADTFELHWFQIAAVLALAARSYSPGHLTIFGRILDGADQNMRNLPELWQHVEAEARHE